LYSADHAAGNFAAVGYQYTFHESSMMHRRRGADET
jgi:hypothetical protein